MAKKSDEELQAYIDELRLHGIPSKAARAAGMTLRTVKEYREVDDDFALEEELAQEEAGDYLEEAARERAVDGIITHEKRDGDGQLIERKRTYSDSLLAKMLDGAKPDKYASRSKQELSQPGGKPLFDDVGAAARIASLLSIAKGRKQKTLLSDDDELLN